MNLSLSFVRQQSSFPDLAPMSQDILETPKQLARLCALLALDKKATDVVVLEVGHLTSYADYFMICSVSSERQAIAIAHHIQVELKEQGKITLGVEGVEPGHWILLDYGNVVCHIFLESSRQYYDLENFWPDAPKVPVE